MEGIPERSCSFVFLWLWLSNMGDTLLHLIQARASSRLSFLPESQFKGLKSLEIY
jgi:hypothetical protein